MTPEQQARLEVLKVSYRHDKSPQDNIESASLLSEFVLHSTSNAAKVKQKPGRKPVDNPEGPA